MGLTQVSTDGVKNDAITKTKIPANQIEASELADNAVDTNAIADQAVALSKLPHGTSSNNGKFLRANNGADPTFETVNTDLVSDTSPQLGGTLDTNGQDILFNGAQNISWDSSAADLIFNDYAKLNLGTDKDFKAYQDGNNTLLQSSNTSGGVYLQGALVQVGSETGEVGVKFIKDGAAELYHDNSKKLETSSIGINIFGDSTVGVNTSTHGNLHFVSPSDNASARYSRIRKNYNSPFNMEYFASTSSSDQNHVFYSDLTTERVRFQKTGGISFNGDTAAANALDDYEEGSFTATMNSSNNDASFNSGQTTTGLYTKIGGLVHVTMYFGCNIASSGSGVAMISGLPFTSNNSTYYPLTITHSTLTQSTLQNGYVQYGNTIFYPIRENATGGSALNAGNPRYIMIAGCYPAW